MREVCQEVPTQMRGRMKQTTAQRKAREDLTIVLRFKAGKTTRELAVLYGREPWEIESVVREFMKQTSEE